MPPISDDLPVYWRYWGKTAASEGMGVHLLPFHLLDVAAVAHQLLRAGSSWSRQLSALSHLGETEARALLVHLCALHDIGKFAESFQSLRPDLRQHYFPDQDIERTDYRVKHDTLCWLLWDQSLGAHIEQTVLHHDVTYAGRDALDIWMQAVSGHHGVPPAHPAEPVGRHFSASDIAATVAFFDDWHGVCPLPVEAILAGYCQH